MIFPGEFTGRIEKQSYINAEALLEALEEPSPVSIRLNPFKWLKEPAGGLKVQWCDHGWYLGSRPSYTLDPLFHSGCYYPQEASGMFAGEAFRQLSEGMSNIKVLDLCGAPGGKSTNISSALGGRGVLVTNEVIRQRAGILSSNMARWGIANTIVTSSDPSAFSRLGNYFDIITVDAPCSGEGMFRDEIAIREWSVANAKLCSERQRRILGDIWPALKNEGFLIYSTCTFNPSENEENVKWLAGETGAESVSLNIERFAGIQEIEYMGIKGYGFYPGMIAGEGFFLAVLRKKGAGVTTGRTGSAKSVNKISREEEVMVSRLFNGKTESLIKRDGKIFSVPVTPAEFEFLGSRISIIKSGTFICEVKGAEAIPTHELALSVLRKEDAFPSTELNYEDAVAFLRKENLKPGNMSNGWNVMQYKGIALGFTKSMGSRINNYFPVEWRIRMSGDRTKEDIIGWK